MLKDVLDSGVSPKDKAYCLDANYWKTTGNTDRSFEYTHARNRRPLIFEPIKLGFVCGKDYQQNRVYSVRGKSVSINGNGGGWGANTGLYKIDLPDGEYAIRKLTPVECERLQTWPYNYTEGVSPTQRYKMIGNGWTADVIAHIFGFIPREE